jgi:glycogen operon protein
VRHFWRGDAKHVRQLATRMSGSADLYLRDGRKPFHSINYITSHDGFTLRDLVSYNYKHNDENGEENRDGGDNNLSFNCGFEGATENPEIEALREQQLKNFMTTLMVSQGTPMLTGGDEFARTQKGNNNAYCQDNEISWYNWNLVKKHAGLFRFAKGIIALRKRHHVFQRPEFYTGKSGSYNAPPDVSWYDASGGAIDWEKIDFAFAERLEGTKADIIADKDDSDFYIMFNGGAKDIKFKIPETNAGDKWRMLVDTAMPSPYDIFPLDSEKIPPDVGAEYKVKSRSIVLLCSKEM